MRSAAEVNVAAEQRFVEGGHRAYVQPSGAVKVVSDTHHGKWYRVTFEDKGAGIVFRCEPQGSAAYADDHLAIESNRVGVTPCLHGAGAARRLERERLAVLDVGTGLWRAVVPAASDEDEDVFAGLPGVDE